MSIRRAREHCIWYDGFGANGPNPVTDLGTASLVLKHLALFYRGLVISDADLNNNPLFHPITQDPESKSSRTFREAIKAGFIRRAARVVRDPKTGSSAATQVQVFHEFQERDEEAAKRVPRSHPSILHDMFSVAEKEVDPLYWSRADLDTIFASRLVFEVASYTTSSAHEVRDLALRVDGYARECLEQKTNVSAATLQRTLRQRADGLGSSRIEALDKVWKAVQRAYHGNLPLAFDGDLIVGTSPGLGPSITGGPAATPEELRMTMQAFAQQNSTGRATVMTVVSEEGKGKWPAPRLVNLGWLGDLSFSEIEKRRDEAYPEEMMDLRFAVLGAPDSADELRLRHADATARFLSKHREYLDILHDSPPMGQRVWLEPAGDGPRVVAAITSPDPSMPCAIADPSLFRGPDGRRHAPASSSLDQSFALTIVRHHWRGLPGGIRRDPAGRLDVHLPSRAITVAGGATPEGEAIDAPGESMRSSAEVRAHPRPRPSVVGPPSRPSSLHAAARTFEQLNLGPTGQIEWRRLLDLEEAAQLVLLAFAYVSNEGHKGWQYAAEHFSFEDGRFKNYTDRVVRRFSDLRNREPPLEWERFLGIVPEIRHDEIRRKIVEPGRGGRPRRPHQA